LRPPCGVALEVLEEHRWTPPQRVDDVGDPERPPGVVDVAEHGAPEVADPVDVEGVDPDLDEPQGRGVSDEALRARRRLQLGRHVREPLVDLPAVLGRVERDALRSHVDEQLDPCSIGDRGGLHRQLGRRLVGFHGVVRHRPEHQHPVGQLGPCVPVV